MTSTKGYKLERVGRNGLKYQFGSKSLTIDVEPGNGLAVYLSTVQHWDTPNDNEIINEQDMAVIRDNIQEGLKFLGTKSVFA